MSKRSWLLDLSLIVFVIGIFYCLLLGHRPLSSPDEARYSEIPREMVATNDYVIPHLNGNKYFEKPPFFYWIQSVGIKLFGLSEWNLRLPTALMGVLGCILTYLGARILYNRLTAIIASMILSSTFLYWGLARFITIDMTLTTLLTGSLMCFAMATRFDFTTQSNLLQDVPNTPSKNNLFQKIVKNQRSLLLTGFYFFSALAVLSKGLIGLLFPTIIAFTWLLLMCQKRKLPSLYLTRGTFIVLAINLPWHILVQLRDPDFFNFYFIQQHFLRYFTTYSSREKPIWFFPAVLILGFLPWTGFLLSTLKNKIFEFRQLKKSSTEIFLLLWVIIIFFFYLFSHSQLVPYLLPIFPPLAILTASYIHDHRQEKIRLNFGFLFSGISLVLLTLGATLYCRQYSIMIDPWLATGLVVGCLSTILGNILFRTKVTIIALSSQFLGTMTILLSICLIAPSLMVNHSVKPLALELKTLIHKDDLIYHYNHYYQDFTFYLERPVGMVNWTGELTYASQHHPPKGSFLMEDAFWKIWPNQQRKFLLMKIKDYEHIKNVFPEYIFFPVCKTKNEILICNQVTFQHNGRNGKNVQI